MREHDAGTTETGRQWRVSEISLRSPVTYHNPFTDVDVWARASAPSGKVWHVPAFHDGDGAWRLRLTPDEPGEWHLAVQANPPDPALAGHYHLAVEPAAGRGFLRACPGEHWGFRYDDGAPALLLGDTMYNIFGAAHCGIDPRPVLERRRAQGYNLIRARLAVSPFHQPDSYNQFEGRSYWPWGGSPQNPQLDRFNLAYFQTVDRVVRLAEELDMGIEMILEGWMFEFPFNSRDRFTAEHEELWTRYLVARYDAFRSVAMWTTANEYVYYPAGRHQPNDTTPDRWAARLARIIRLAGPHDHPITVHTMTDPTPTFAERLARYPEIDIILYQNWGRRDEDYAWLAGGIEEAIARQCAGARQVCVLSEYGYERDPASDTLPPGHAHLTADHTRRGAWRGAFMGVCVFSGFDNTWGPVLTVEPDCPGAGQLRHLWTYLTEIAPFTSVRPVDLPGLTGGQPELPYSQSRALASADRSLVAVYLPAGGRLALPADLAAGITARWFDPRTGAEHPAEHTTDADGQRWHIPPTGERAHDDWALTLRRETPSP